MKQKVQKANTIKEVLNLLESIGINTSPHRVITAKNSNQEISCRMCIFANHDEEELRKLRHYSILI